MQINNKKKIKTIFLFDLAISSIYRVGDVPKNGNIRNLATLMTVLYFSFYSCAHYPFVIELQLIRDMM